MGRKKLTMKLIENPTTRQMTYTKRKDGILKKANELSILCDTDVGLILFSPNGRLTCFASNRGKVEDVFLRFVDRPDELRGGPIRHEEFLSQRLKYMKYEGAMMEKITIIEELEKKLDKLTTTQRDIEEKMRYYDPKVELINSSLEAGVHEQFLTSALQNVQSAKARMLGKKLIPRRAELVVEPRKVHMDVDDASSATEPSNNVNHKGNNPTTTKDEDVNGTTSLKANTGPHLSLSFIQGSKKWNV